MQFPSSSHYAQGSYTNIAILDISALLQAMTDPEQILIKIRTVLNDHARLGADATSLAIDANLYEAGMTSHASVNVMLALEGEFDIEFPDHMLRRNVFDSIGSIQGAVRELTGG